MTIARVKIAVAVLLFAIGGLLWALSLTGHAEEATAPAEPVELTSLVQPLEASLHTDALKAALQGDELLGVFVLPVGDCPPPLIDVDAYTHLLQELLSAEEAEGLAIALVNEDKPLAERYVPLIPGLTPGQRQELLAHAAEGFSL